MKSSKRFSPEVKERAVRLFQDSRTDHKSEWSAICSIATKIGCGPETLKNWIRQAEAQPDDKPSESDAERIKRLEREVFELRRANEILRKASAFFAQAELHRPLKKW